MEHSCSHGSSWLQLFLAVGTSSKARLRFPGGAHTGVVKKGALVEYIGNNVNTFCYDVMSRTMKM